MGEKESIWKPVAIDGYRNDYLVSDSGEIMSIKTGHRRKLKAKYNKRTGYDYVVLGYNGNSITRSVHRLVAEAFIPKPDGKNVINHINEDKRDNRVSNLEWVTVGENNSWSKHRHYKPVEVWSVDGELIATFTSERGLSEFIGMSKSAVCSALKGTRGSCGGFILKYADCKKVG